LVAKNFNIGTLFLIFILWRSYMNYNVETKDFVPYLAFAVNKACSFRCVYCEEGGESTASTQSQVGLKELVERSIIALEEGIQKFRITGGEPMLHPQFGRILEHFSQVPAEVTLNTAGFFTSLRKDEIREFGQGIDFICSVDSLREETFDRITQRRGFYKQTIEGTKILADIGVLKRLNMILLPWNKDEVFDMITYCKTLGCDLKIADIARVTQGYSQSNSIFYEIGGIEAALTECADEIITHSYSENIGIPMSIYSIDGVEVTVKGSHHNTRFAKKGPCNDCEENPCEEGLYFINSLPDGSLSGCRLNKYFKPATSDFRTSLREMMSMFKSIYGGNTL
jgi:molybdenum cofactor biosynthesis enzyme MoaA